MCNNQTIQRTCRGYSSFLTLFPCEFEFEPFFFDKTSTVETSPAVPSSTMNPERRYYSHNLAWRLDSSSRRHRSSERQIIYYDGRHAMVPSLSSNSNITNMSSSDERNVADDRIHSSQRQGQRADGFETTADGDVVFVQPSFEDDGSKSAASPQKDWQARSPQQVEHKSNDEEPRNPSSPSISKPRAVPGHTRDLSAHFYDATTLGNSSSEDSGEDVLKGDLSRKHRRMMSGGVSNPNHAHRRLNSVGQAVPVKRQHQRVDSQGLVMLSAVADAPKEDLVQGAEKNTWDPSLSANQHHHRMSSGNGFGFLHSSAASDHHRRLSSNNGLPFGHFSAYPPHPGMAPPYPVGPYPPSQAQPYYAIPGYPPARAGYPQPPPPPPPPPHYPSYAAVASQPPSTQAMYPPDNRAPTLDETGTSGKPAETATSGSQTFVTAMAVGHGTKTLRPTVHSRHASTNTDFGLGNVPTHIASNHHRKLSSFSSLGLSTIFAPTSDKDGQQHPLKSGGSHHRSTSSSVSFLNLGVDPDDTFLRNLQESSNADYCRPVAAKSAEMTKSFSPTNGGNSSGNSDHEGHDSDSKLAAGGTSKRVRRKCNIAGCPNRVVQGGLCISHGAKRKTCKHPGCNKNVKKAGLCSTHGPARKRCDAPGCPKVAVQGGRCIAHGAKKKLCSVEHCDKQAILSGMCKRHHDDAKKREKGSGKTDGTAKPKHVAKHTRGISIFHDLSADAVQNLLGNDGSVEPAPPARGPFM